MPTDPWDHLLLQPLGRGRRRGLLSPTILYVALGFVAAWLFSRPLVRHWATGSIDRVVPIELAPHVPNRKPKRAAPGGEERPRRPPSRGTPPRFDVA